MSKSKSKTHLNSKNSSRSKHKTSSKHKISGSGVLKSDSFLPGALGDLAVGHQPIAQLQPQDQVLYRAFQANLLSLVSHELRTPLTGILNSLAVLEEGVELGGLSTQDLVKMAKENAERLHQALLVLLDLASLETGSLHIQLKELDLCTLVRSRLENRHSELQSRSVSMRWNEAFSATQMPILGDPQKLARVIDLCFQVLLPRVEAHTEVRISLAFNQISFVFQLAQNMEKHWETAWSESIIGVKAGVNSPYSAFAGVLQAEQAFLTRVEEGFGSEFLLIHEIMRLHQGKFTAALRGQEVTMSIELPELSSEEGLRAVLSSRTYRVSMEFSSVALILIQLPQETSLESLKRKVRETLFRTSDAVYWLPARQQLALVLDDCRKEDTVRIMDRVQSATQQKLIFSSVHCPTDGLDPLELLELGDQRLRIK